MKLAYFVPNLVIVMISYVVWVWPFITKKLMKILFREFRIVQRNQPERERDWLTVVHYASPGVFYAGECLVVEAQSTAGLPHLHCQAVGLPPSATAAGTAWSPPGEEAGHCASGTPPTTLGSAWGRVSASLPPDQPHSLLNGRQQTGL